MAASPLSDVVADQYSRWRYPEPIVDLPGWLENNWQWFDPSHSHRLFWPDRAYWPGMQILVAGCGTNQAAVIAFNNPEAAVLAIDVSQPSLDHHRFLKDKYGLGNLELRQLPIEQLGSLKRDFDLIISTGVLHHLASPEAGMKALADSLRPEGVAAIMLYARHGRTGVSMLQAAFREMGLGQNDASIAIVREVLDSLDAGHPVRAYLALAPDLGSDAGLVDTFLHGREQAYEIGECRALVESAGLTFQDLYFKAPYQPPPLASGPFHDTLADLRPEQQWSIMERLNFRNGCHFFMACRPERDAAGYAVDWERPSSLDAIPVLRYRCTFSASQICRPGWCLELEPAAAGVARLVDGRRTTRELVALASRHRLALEGEAAAQSLVTATLRRLWCLDFLAVELPRP